MSVVQEKPFKTELIIPKVHPMEKPLIKEERDSPNDSRNMNLLNISSNLTPKDENNLFSDNLYLPQAINSKDAVSFGRKEAPFINHLQPKHALNLKESPIDMHKDQIINMNHSNFMNSANEMKQEPFGYQNPPPSQPQPEKSTAGNNFSYPTLLKGRAAIFNFVTGRWCQIFIGDISIITLFCMVVSSPCENIYKIRKMK